MAVLLGKLTIVVGAGLVGSALSKEVGLLDVGRLFSGAFKIVTKSLQADKDGSKSTFSRPHADSILAQVNTLRQELQLLASSRSVTIVTGTRSGCGTFSVTTVIVIGCVGYGYIWWKGWKLSDMMFVTRRGFSDACSSVGKQVDLVSSSLASAKRHLSSKIDHVDSNIDECKELTAATKDEVSGLHGDLSEFLVDVESVRCVVQTLETKLVKIEENQGFATEGVYHLCKFVQKLESMEQAELIQQDSRPSIGPPTATETSSMPTSALESPSPSSSSEPPKVLHTSKAASSSDLKGFLFSDTFMGRNSRTTSADPSSATSSKEEPFSRSNSSRSKWRPPVFSILARIHDAYS